MTAQNVVISSYVDVHPLNHGQEVLSSNTCQQSKPVLAHWYSVYQSKHSLTTPPPRPQPPNMSLKYADVLMNDLWRRKQWPRCGGFSFITLSVCYSFLVKKHIKQDITCRLIYLVLSTDLHPHVEFPVCMIHFNLDVTFSSVCLLSFRFM